MKSSSISSSENSLSLNNSGVGNKATVTLNQSASYGSIINQLLTSLVENFDADFDDGDTSPLPDHEDKLDFNNVIHYKEDILDNIIYLSVVEDITDTIDNEKPRTKEKILKAINRLYKTEKRNILIDHDINPSDKENVIKALNSNADIIFRNINSSLLELSKKDLIKYDIERVQSSIDLILCYAFINCRILENPNDY